MNPQLKATIKHAYIAMQQELSGNNQRLDSITIRLTRGQTELYVQAKTTFWEFIKIDE